MAKRTALPFSAPGGSGAVSIASTSSKALSHARAPLHMSGGVRVFAGHGAPLMVTGFGPFPGVADNASARLVSALAAHRAAHQQGEALSQVPLIAAVLPTCWDEGLAMAADLVLTHRPRAVLHFGVSSRAQGFEIELIARNATCAVEDAAGDLPALTLLQYGGPPRCRATIPVLAMVERLRLLSIPAVASRDAGLYLCNAVMYQTLGLAARHALPLHAGFIHIPEQIFGINGGTAGSTARTSARPARGGGRQGERAGASAGLKWSEAVSGALALSRLAARLPAPRSRASALRSPHRGGRIA
ncbi:MAG: hypothetical protein AAFR04_08760 [Pseudomonadota bacterium]